jgi:hypothetical protein
MPKGDCHHRGGIMGRCFTLAMLVACGAALAFAQPQKRAFIGSWELLSRIDRDRAGNLLDEPSLGRDPIGYLVYDEAGRMYVQIMARHRAEKTTAVTAPADTNNLAQVGGYDAYFGRFDVDSARGTVTHALEGAIAQGDVGRVLTRRYTLRGDTLTLQFEPGGQAGNRIRTLIWHRISR